MNVDSGPRLVLNRDELGGLRQRIESTHAAFYRALVGELEGRLGEDVRPFRWDLEEPDYSDFLEIGFSVVVNSGIAYHLDSDARWRDLAERWLRHWVSIGPAQGDQLIQSYLVAFHVMALAYGLDLLGDELPDDLVGQMVDVMSVETGAMVRGMASGESGWSRRYLYHDCWVPVFGLGVGCMALLPHNEEARTWLSEVEGEVEQITSLLGSDGAWNEGVAPLNYALGPMLFYLEGRKRVFGEPAFEIPWLWALPKWRAYHWLPDGTYVFLDDSTPSGRYHGETGGAVDYQLYKLASENKDGLAQWQAQYESERTFLKDYHGYSWRLLWYDPDIHPQHPETLPLSEYFPSMGQFFSRSGWGEQDSVLSFECTMPGGPLGQVKLGAGLPPETITQNKHAHYRDRASFTFHVGGQYLFRPSGYFRFETELKNALTIDGVGQSLEPDSGGGITGSHPGEGDLYSAVHADAAAAYLEVRGLSGYDRTILHHREQNALFVLDRVWFSDESTHEVDAHFHVGRDVTVTPQPDGSLQIVPPSGGPYRLACACAQTPGFEQVPQPVDPYWRDYLSGYDIPPEDLEAMEQVDLKLHFGLEEKKYCEMLWMVLPEGGGGVGEVVSQAGSWGALIGIPSRTGSPDVFVAPAPGTPDKGRLEAALPERPGRLFVIGGHRGRHLRLSVDEREDGQWGITLGEGELCRFSEAGTVCVDLDT
ncbi:MAG: heparinase II/III family protein [Candidatus Latescibacteria bacterium]|nr:heparinase II/III family protein [Candidatus Latescibacterota bacterium]